MSHFIKWKRGYLWVTLGFFLFSIVGHWLFAWFAYVEEQEEFGKPIKLSDYAVQTIRDTLENWQSEFLQLIWQVAGLAVLLYVGSPQSREGHDRMEDKIDHLIKVIDGANATKAIEDLERKYPKE